MMGAAHWPESLNESLEHKLIPRRPDPDGMGRPCLASFCRGCFFKPPVEIARGGLEEGREYKKYEDRHLLYGYPSSKFIHSTRLSFFASQAQRTGSYSRPSPRATCFNPDY